MNDYIFHDFLENLRKKEAKPRNFSITPKNLEQFQIASKGEGIIELEDIAALYDWAKNILRYSAHTINFIVQYHPDSPRYWKKNVNKPNEYDRLKYYAVSIDLEDFIESKSSEESTKKHGGNYTIPDNYELARKVFAEFKKHKTYTKQFVIEENHYRELANWETKTKEAANALANFIDEKYVQPKLQEVLKSNNIKKCIFDLEKNQIDFEYFDTPLIEA